VRYRSVVDEQIERAQQRGEFDNLPGKGKPLPGLHGPDDELWWVRGYVEREGLSGDTLLPPELRLRKEVQRLPDLVRELGTEDAVREAVRELNLEIVHWIRNPSGPNIVLGPVNADRIVAGWREHRRARPPAPPSASADAPGVASAGVPAPAAEPTRRRWWRGRRRAG
jgi:hypothetical protein